MLRIASPWLRKFSGTKTFLRHPLLHEAMVVCDDNSREASSPRAPGFQAAKPKARAAPMEQPL